MKVLTVLGTRPEAIKLAPVIRELERHAGVIESRVCVTRQHDELLEPLLPVLSISPDHDLGVMTQNQSPADVVAAVLSRLSAVLKSEAPDWVLVQGDTATVTGAALATFYARSQLGHVEAALRSYDKWHPFPEEMNRRVAGLLADMHFAPTQRARENLLLEGVPHERIAVTGNTVIDALRWASDQPLALSADSDGELDRELLERLEGRRLLLVTAHRRESFGQPLQDICSALRELADAYGDRVHILYPVHPNPNVAGPVREALDGLPNITLTGPLNYVAFVHMMKRAYLILTDSGGMQEEAPEFGVPVLVMREVTERPEAVEAGTARLVGMGREDILRAATELLDDEGAYSKMSHVANPFGDGAAAERIVRSLLGEPFDPWGSPA